MDAEDLFMVFMGCFFIFIFVIGINFGYKYIIEENKQNEILERVEDLEGNPDYTFYLDGTEIDASKYYLENYDIKIDDNNSTVLLHKKED